MSKGSRRRPLSVSQAEYDAKYEALFGKRKKLSNPDPVSDPEPIADVEQDEICPEKPEAPRPPYERRRFER